ncbi:2804_t:CDS:2 [Acaulospora colombiana]|uniref:2804_t:CDS:1 n=1 Tax=Acaulospora colombiana TaxID=27376 RepID=A0ACA9K7I9_9GLOM|nr:2804_t:CDS:2 [Acaulospora colombiana]
MNRSKETEEVSKKFEGTSAEKYEFLREFSSKYGYNGKIDSIRENEYPQLKGAVYLDHSGATTYAKSILTSFHNDLTRNLFGNPHSHNPSSMLTSHRVEQVRLRVLKHFDASPEDYQVIFTQNATAAIKVVAQCNFSGQRFPLSWANQVKRKLNTKNSKYLVLLDAAAYLTSSTLSLADKDKSPDFVAMSFYKIFGFPTGLGALLVKTELEPMLKKRYFGGGTITAVAYDRQWQKFRSDLSERYEDGTINFLDIISLHHAFTVTERIYTSFQYIKPHVTTLITYLDRRMRAFRHWNGMPVCVVHADHDYSDNVKQGPVYNFNVRKVDGNWVPYGEIENLASANGIHLRSGGLCNPGCVARWINLSAEEVIRNYQHGKICGDDQYIFNNKITGAVRISLGAMTTIDDIFKWLHFFETYYVESVAPESATEKAVQFYSQGAYNSSQTNLQIKTSTKKKRMSISSPNLILQLQEDMKKTRPPHQKEKLLGERRRVIKALLSVKGFDTHD